VQTLELRAEARTLLGKKVRQLRRQGLTPANIFGHGPSRPIQATTHAVELLLLHGGRTSLLSIELDSGKTETALIKHVTRDPRTDRVLHLDLQAVSLTETVSTTVPLRFVGESPAVSKMDGVLVHTLSELKVEAQARYLPEAIEVHVDTLTELGSAIHVSDLKVPQGVTILAAEDEVVAVVQAPKGETEAEAEAAEEAPAEGAEAETTEAAPEEGAAAEESTEER